MSLHHLPPTWDMIIVGGGITGAGILREATRMGLNVLLVEQNVREALDLADRGYVLQTGRIVGEGSGKALLESDMFREVFLGI